jgi:holin-like protein
MVLSFLAVLLLCQLAGEVFVALTGLPVPGPVVGLVLLFMGLRWHGQVPEGLGRVVDTLLGHLSLLFVPAGVGVMLHMAIVSDQWLAIGAALIVSTILTLVVTALVMTALTRWVERRDSK